MHDRNWQKAEKAFEKGQRMEENTRMKGSRRYGKSPVDISREEHDTLNFWMCEG